MMRRLGGSRTFGGRKLRRVGGTRDTGGHVNPIHGKGVVAGVAVPFVLLLLLLLYSMSGFTAFTGRG